ncbi:MAG TPA: C25 family cysteine peptidase [Pyrinomonadaceae bacterium]|nr:C25 family cysteine peptidase [Pyrinomonadaceae bacterium]
MNNENHALFLIEIGTVSIAGTATLDSDIDDNDADATLSLDTGLETGTLNLAGSTPISLNGLGSEILDFDGAGATVIYSGGTQTVQNTTYTNLTIAGTNSKTPAGTTGFIVTDNLNINTGAFLDVSSFVITLMSAVVTVNGTLDFSNDSGQLDNSTGTSTITMGANGLIRTVDSLGIGPVNNSSLENNGTAITTVSVDTTGSVEYYRATAQAVFDRNYNNLIITNAGTKTFTKSATRTLDGHLTINAGATLALAGLNALAVGGNWTNNGTFTHSAGSVAFNGTTNQSIGGASANTFLALTIANAGIGSDVVSLTSSALTTVTSALNINQGVFDQGASSNLQSNTVTIGGGGTFRNFGTGDLTLAGNVSNAGTILFSALGSPCGDADDILISSNVAGQRTWTNTGTLVLSDVTVEDMAGTVVVQSGTNNGNNAVTWTFIACTSAVYTWNGGVLGSWIVAANWTPARTTSNVADVLIIDGTSTPAPTITNVPTQEIAALRLINGADLNLQAGAANNVLTISGTTGTDLSVPSGSVLTLSTANALILNIASGSTAGINGQIIFQDGAHRLRGNAASAALFHSGAIFMTTTGFTGNPFGPGGGGTNGTTSSIQFESGSAYFHNAGDSPFGSAANPAVTVFQTGSEADWLTSTGFQASGRTYANLVIGNSSTAVDVSDSGTGNFTFNTLVINSSGSDDSSLTFTGSGASAVNVLGNITSANTGLGGTLADVSLTAGTGGIQINSGGTQTFGNIANSRSIFFGSNATVGAGTTLNLSRLVQMGLSADGLVTDNGTIVPNFSSVPGYIIGAIRRPTVPAGTYVFALGKVTGYTPVEFNNATGTADVTITAVNGTVTPVTDATSLDEYWTITLNRGSLTTDIEFTYLDADVDGSEAFYKVIRVEYGAAAYFAATTVDTGLNTATVTGVDHFSDWTLGETVGASAVKLTRFNAVRFEDGVELTWESGYEVDNLGYHIYREQNGKRTLVTPGIVAGSALKVGPGNRMTAGYSYSWFDRNDSPDATYHLEAVDLSGATDLVGPVYPSHGIGHRRRARAPRARMLHELASGNSSDERLSTWPTETGGGTGESHVVPATAALLTQQAIAAGNAVKIQVRNRGWCRITQAELVGAGFDPSTDARMWQLYVDGVEVPISLSSEGARLNNNDTLEFYGVPLDTPTTETRTYWLVKGGTFGKRMIARRGKLKTTNGETDSALRSFKLTVERREKIIYFSSLLNGDAENIFGPLVDSFATVEQILPVNNLDSVPTSHPELEIALQGLTKSNHSVTVKINGTTVGTVSFNGRQHPIRKFPVPLALLQNGNNVVSLQSSNGPADISLIDWVRLSYPHRYRADANSLRFTAPGGQAVSVGGFSTPNVRVIDVTNPDSPTQHSALSSLRDGAYTAIIQVPGNGFRELIAFTDDLSGHPASITTNRPSTFSDAANGADMLIITHKEFKQAIEPLAALRRSQGLVVSVVDVEDVYDEFSFGAHTPDAIKSFLAVAHTAWQRKPRFVLLVGDSSWDPRDHLQQGPNDFVPTKLIDTVDQETSSDDWFADFAGFGLPSMAIGRLPGRSVPQIDLMVSKIVAYEQERELNRPLRGALLVADNGFESKNAQTKALLPRTLVVQSINRAQVGNDDVMRGQVIDALNAGPTLVNYYGHGSVGVWTGEALLDNDLATSLTNTNRLSLYLMMTCLNGYASDAYVDSLAESALKAPNGGAVAVWASSGFTVPDPQFALSSEFYRLLFSGQPVRLGEATRGAKAATTDLDVRRTWILLGDPAMRIR